MFLKLVLKFGDIFFRLYIQIIIAEFSHLIVTMFGGGGMVI